MSDPVTNVEIEDVLSSIRRLVSDGDKARTREAPSAEMSLPQSEAGGGDSVQAAESSTDRFVLTPALMVVEDQPFDSEAKVEIEDGTDEGWFRDDDNASEDSTKDETNEHRADFDNTESGPNDDHEGTDAADLTSEDTETATDDAQGGDVTSENDDAGDIEGNSADEPLELTNIVWEPVEDAPVSEQDVDITDQVAEDAETGEFETLQPDATDEIRTPDRSALVATITELEAAVSGEENDFEPDGSEVMGQTIAWPGAVARDLENIEDAVSDTDGGSSDVGVEPPVETVSNDAPQEAAVEAQSDSPEDTDSYAEEVFEDDDLDGLLEAGGVALDEEALRALVSDVVREELTGPLGERITRNVRKLVRREIYRILSSQEFD